MLIRSVHPLLSARHLLTYIQTVHERVMPAVSHHTITRTQIEEVEVAVDREQHVDHYH